LNAAGSKEPPDPLEHLGALFVVRVADGFEEFDVSASASDVFGGRAGGLAADGGVGAHA
jgi:hypothetical protein